MLEWRRGGLTQEILDKHIVLYGGDCDTPELGLATYAPGESRVVHWSDAEWYCILPEITVYDPGMDWVDLPQDHVYRNGDEYFNQHEESYEPARGVIGKKVGDTDSKKGRCRRKDLTPQKRKIVLTEWLVRERNNWCRTVQTDKPVGDEVIRIKDHEYEVDA